MNEQFVPYEIALKLKEKGFDEPCFADFFFFEDGNVVLDRDEDRECIITQNPEENITKCLAPLWQQVIDWFRVVHKIYLLEQVTIDPHGDVYYGVVKTGKMYRNTEISEDPIKAKQFAIEYALTLI